ncbi:MAG: hypothetical protein PHE47_09410 [Oscillospiraceae bacterium]|nr:hypothetical protein [Oscillospiraceae bacterium]
MKKLFAFILATLTAASLTVAAFAQTSAQKSGVALSIGSADGLTLDGSALLYPGEEYRFPLLIAQDGGEARPLTVEDMSSYDIKVTAKSGFAAMEQAGRLESGRQQYLSLTPGSVFTVSAQEVQYTVTLQQKNSGAALSQITVRWKVGYPSMDDAKLGVSTAIDPAAPVLTGAQFSAIQKLTGDKQASFTGTGWQFDVRLLDQQAVNFHYSAQNLQAISDQYPNADFRFLHFGGKPAFDFSGRLTLDVSAALEEYDDLYLYRYLDGVLYSLKYNLDKENETISIQTKQLGSYVISDTKIPNGTAVGGASSGGASADSGKDNPTTGGADFSGIAAALGHLSRAGAAAALGICGK